MRFNAWSRIACFLWLCNPRRLRCLQSSEIQGKTGRLCWWQGAYRLQEMPRKQVPLTVDEDKAATVQRVFELRDTLQEASLPTARQPERSQRPLKLGKAHYDIEQKLLRWIVPSIGLWCTDKLHRPFISPSPSTRIILCHYTKYVKKCHRTF